MRRNTYLPQILVITLGAVLLVALAFAAAPLFHWLWFGVFYLHPVGSVLVIAAVLIALWLFLTRGRRIGCSGWALLALLLAGLIGYARLADGLSQRALVAGLQPTRLDQLPETTEVRYLPMDVAARYGDNRVQDPLYHLGDFDPLDVGDQLNWVAPRVPSGEWNKLTGRNDGLVVVRNDGSVETLAQPMTYGEDMHLGKNVTWQLLRRRYWVDYPEIYYVQTAGEVVGVVPYVGYRFVFPVRVPYWAGVAVFHSDGRIEDLTPEQAQADARFERQRLYPEQLARQVAAAWAYHNGIFNAWFRHVDQGEIPRLADSSNQMPFLLPGPEGPIWFVAAEPYGPAYGIYKMFLFDAHTGALSLVELPVDSSLLGPNVATGYVRSAFPSYSWYTRNGDQSSGNMIATEPRPFVHGGQLYWMVSVTTVESAGITHTALVNARDASILYFNTLPELQDYRAGKFAGRVPAAVQVQVPANGGQTVNPVPAAADLSQLSDRELIDLLRRVTDELSRRQK